MLARSKGKSFTGFSNLIFFRIASCLKKKNCMSNVADFYKSLNKIIPLSVFFLVAVLFRFLPFFSFTRFNF